MRSYSEDSMMTVDRVTRCHRPEVLSPESTGLAGPYSKLLFKFSSGKILLRVWDKELTKPMSFSLIMCGSWSRPPEEGRDHPSPSSVSSLLTELGRRIDKDSLEPSAAPADSDNWMSLTHDL